MKHSIQILIITIIFGLILGSVFVWTGYAQTPEQTQIALNNTTRLLTSIWQGGQPAVQLQAQPPAESILQTTSEVQRTVSVSGSGQVEAQPDQATVRLGVQTDGESAEQALADNNAKTSYISV